MSGGVDSSVCAKLLMGAGYECVGGTMKLLDKETADIGDAKRVCESLGIEHRVFELEEQFDGCVIRPFIESYRRGETPNPCIECNRRLKFGIMQDLASELGCGYVATGHYARILWDGDSGRFLLKKALHPEKDQSYVLFRMTQEQLSRTLFPLGELSKEEVRAAAEEAGFVNARKHDSQDICFVPDGDYAGFIRRYAGIESPPGDFISADGRVLGRHSGIINYTVGQRKGLGISLGERAYVCGIDPDANTVTLGRNEDLFTDRLFIRDINLISCDELKEPLRAAVRIRYSHREQPALITQLDGDLIEIVFDEPQRAVTPGQSAVIYQGDTVVGGGRIVTGLSRIHRDRF